jgi:tetratricopeptide (TPR) repeat protein
MSFTILHSSRPRWGRLLPAVAAASILALGLGAATAVAQTAVSAKVPERQQAAALAEEALEFLEEGEDASDERVKMARYRAGETLARAALALDDSNPDAHFALFATEGRRLVMEGSINPFSLLKVNRSLDRCLELDPNHSDALAARGGMYRQLPTLMGGSLSKAEDYLRRSIELDPESTGARIELAKTYHEMGEEEKVVPLLREALLWAERLNKPRRVREAREFLSEVAGD